MEIAVSVCRERADLLVMTHWAPSWDRVVVMARPRPVPPPVMKATLLLKLPAGSMLVSSGGKKRD